MIQCKPRLLLSALWLLTLPVPVQAITSAALDGTLLFNPQSKGLVNNFRVYHAFDLPYVTQTNIGATFPGETATAPISTMLDAIKNKGYTHIQISPPHLTSPSIQMMPPPIDRKDTDAQQAQVFQSSTTTPVQAVIPPYSYNGWEFAYQPLICVLDSNSVYLNELKAGFVAAGKPEPSSVAAYGVTVNGKTVGYRLGSDRYGSMADLVSLINAAKDKGLGIIADVVFNQTSGYMTDKPSSSGGQFHPFTYVAATGTALATYTWDTSVDLSTFFNPYNKNPPYTTVSWDYGPDLNTSSSMVRQMVVNYMKLLSDIGISGVRFDYLYGLGAADTTAICTQANAAGLFQSSTVPVSFGYGENDQSLTALASYGAVVPVEDHPLHYSLANCFVGGQSMSTLVMPTGIGNMTTATFSTNHDQYPFVAGEPGSGTFYSNSKNPNNPTDTILSQLAIAYICAKRDGNPMILRFEDERDTAGIIQRGLAFRVLMEQKNAPHEYMVALTPDVLLIARQYGFAVINRGSNPYTITQGFISGVPSAYIPNISSNNAYQEVLGLTTPTTGNLSAATTIPTSSSSTSIFTIPLRNAKFFVLSDASSQTAYDVTFSVPSPSFISNTYKTNQVFVVGNHPLLGNWAPRLDLLNGLLRNQNYYNPTATGLTFPPTWTSLPLRFPQNVSLQYKFVVANGGKITRWESGSNRSYTVSGTGPAAATPSW
ncbi:carbohydrate-binding module family 20 domain-containing protein [Candidatus Finniella inopinata]|uniref:CBM20 domain-containing protein n=1 Tax=Candidatus Finniella inopinata TaxID=1696036 RepID=A0A4Q7DHW2_9PROT|nr:carbohydrate-binding module family 20 domain-containing protein [Candidatus Finniella inopinata]RZI45645.1 hypothetical protein EQU50_05960 [Candidatus Finniella inopinata]